ncbi:matrixin [Haloferax sp. MBLA0076]|uniref:Matrixin n=1 Tax=Haloferax litoreum TaxID=2666140 RepID=A0A6A8GEK6_9EURY|nr:MULTISPECIES: matrixin [Haloferax]KAB1193034.1 matrixin [Haloferax sp. CBA1148]MRX21525.1 matrixin [Haloferax litoreum]
MRGLPIFVVLLVALAGCTAPVSLDGDSPTTVTPTATSTPTPATPVSTTDSTETTPTPSTTAETTTSVSTTSPPATETTAPQTTTAEPEVVTTYPPASGYGPWGSDPVIIEVRAPNDGRDYETLVREATVFWERNDARYLGYEVEYAVSSDVRNPDIILQFSDTIPECSGQADAVGCAPYITDASQIDRPETVYVKTGFGDDSTVEIVEHELGHTLGLAHGDEPADLMNATGILFTLPRTDATEKAFPWDDPEFTVYVNESNAKDPDGAREQVGHAFDYYAAGAPGMPDNLSFTYVDDPKAADAHISFSDTSPCGAGAASCAAVTGYDPDGDGALETYDSFRIVLVDLDTEAVGWHVGYWTAHYLGAEDDADKPDPFQNATYTERRSEWWA